MIDKKLREDEFQYGGDWKKLNKNAALNEKRLRNCLCTNTKYLIVIIYFHCVFLKLSL